MSLAPPIHSGSRALMSRLTQTPKYYNQYVLRWSARQSQSGAPSTWNNLRVVVLSKEQRQREPRLVRVQSATPIPHVGFWATP